MDSKHLDWKNSRAKAANQSSNKFRKKSPLISVLKGLAILTALLGILLFGDLFSTGEKTTVRISLKSADQARFGMSENHLIVTRNGTRESVSVSDDFFKSVSHDEQINIYFSPLFQEIIKVETLNKNLRDVWNPKLVAMIFGALFLCPLLIFIRQDFQESVYFVAVFLLFPFLMSIKYWVILVDKL